MKLFSALSVFLFWGMAFAAALPSETSEATAPAAPTASASDAEAAYISKLPDACQNCTRSGLVEALQWEEGDWRAGYIRGSSFIAFHSNGDVRFQTRFRNSNDFFRFKYSISCAIRDAVPGEPAHVFQLSRSGSLGARQTKEVDETRNNPLVAQYWQNILAGDRTMHCLVESEIDLTDLIKKLLGIIKEYGPIIGEIILL